MNTNMSCRSVLMLILLAPLGTHAQEIQVVGTSDHQFAPTRMRMQIVLEEQGKTASAAVDKIVDRRKAALEQLKNLGAEATTVSKLRFPVGSNANTAEAMARAMALQALQLRGGAAPKPPELVTKVHCTISADWNLGDEDDADEQFRYVAELQEALRVADLGGAEEYDAAPVDRNTRIRISSATPTTPVRTPQFAYIVKLDDETHAEALKLAVADAAKDGERIATAASTKLAKMKSLAATAPRIAIRGNPDSTASRVASLTSALNSWPRNSNEFVVSTLEDVVVRIEVRVTYHSGY